MYLFTYMALGLNVFDGANPLHGLLEGVGLENLDLFCPNVALLIVISGPTQVLIFRAHSFQWPSK